LFFLKSRGGERADGGCMREFSTDWRLWTSVGFVSEWFFDGGDERIIWLGRGLLDMASRLIEISFTILKIFSALFCCCDVTCNIWPSHVPTASLELDVCIEG